MGNNNGFKLVSVSKIYQRGADSTTIFDDLNMDIPAGLFLALMGPSGSGKTTLLNLLAGVDRPSSGQVLFDGKRIDDMPQASMARWRARNVGFVFQSYNLLPMLSAEQNVSLPLSLMRMTSAERKRRVASALDLVGLSHRARHMPSQLSGGEQQRVAIARAIVGDAPVLLCDEPTGNLDRAVASEVLDLLRDLNRELGKTVVMVTHDQRAAGYATLGMQLDKGRFVDMALAAA
ncbi:ABC transporter ATP-binding protein [Lysobacter sp. cf310]|uniref:ABC transporter ATP-binding protein n=1 Tax=Lysobacter sp. cf310 TaxID=1761790 RepID=UPI0008E8432D|nr:ABC transporter ATP-binding protein [Lysobacter sp. cf310]SFK94966.1 putative ABC transport system ATP-binding protein [Lysobacter sp. cf310]